MLADAWIDSWNERQAVERHLGVRWLVNPGQVPVENVRITVFRESVSDVTPVSDGGTADILPAVLIPCLVNAHTHLEFSTIQEPFPAGRVFTDWIDSVIDYRSTNEQDVSSAVQAGLRESHRHGVAAVGEISTSDAGSHALKSSDAWTVSFRELIGFNRRQLDSQLEVAQKHLDRSRGIVHPALSPHAPYSVHPELFAASVDLARQYSVPLAMHLAETREELQLLASGTGPFVDLLTRLNLWDESVIRSGTRPLWYLEQLAGLSCSLVIHGNYLDAQECAYLCRHPELTTVYCPRTHRHFGHAPHPWRRLMKAGASVALGTDSRASNPDLSLWRELQFVLRQAGDEPFSELLKLATTNGARGLGLGDDMHVGAGRFCSGLLIPCEAQYESQLTQQLSFPSASQPYVLNQGQIAISPD